MSDLTVHVLFRCSKKTGKVDMEVTSLGCAQLKLFALQKTPSTKQCLIFERESGKLVYHIEGNKDGFPTIVKYTEEQTCEDFGISLEVLHSIKDERFDKEA